MIQKLGLLGKLRVGKDYVAEHCGYHRLSFAQPLTRICEYFFGRCDKDRLDHRRFLQKIGGWGWGADTEDKMTRAWFNWWARTQLPREIPELNYVNWGEFGKRRDFWVNMLLTRERQIIESDTLVSVTNVRHLHEMDSLGLKGFQFYLVRCSDETREARNNGNPFAFDKDISERLASRAENDFPPHRQIWNDDCDPPNPEMLSLEEFKELAIGVGV